MADNWTRLHDGQTYKIFRTDDRSFRYCVTRPNGSVLTSASTLWGARRAIRKAIRKGPKRKWWEFPIVAEVDPDGGVR